jgi:D-alanyl-D-alanine carboxypeptidase (penicillin-binding protein 5/6)
MIFSTVLFIGGRDIYFHFTPKPPKEESSGGVAAEKGDFPYADGASGAVLLPWADKVDIIPENSIYSAHAALADLSTGKIIASRKADEVIYPASMTKVMTLIVVVENLPNGDCLEDEITVSQAVYDAMKAEGSSGIGMAAGEKLTVESLLYALMLRSDGIAASELARYVAGSEEDFVELMNQKAEKMGLSNTHFENPTGLHHPNHKSTAREIASIMAYAMNMKLCRKVLLTQSYTAPCVGADGAKFNYNLYHNLMVTKFDEIPVNQPKIVKVAAGKTGFTDEARFCLVTYAESSDGHGYVCVTAEGDSYNACIADYIAIYNTYAKP